MSEKVIAIVDSITVSELAEQLNLPITNLIGELFKNGIVATINQRIDFDTATIIIEELGIKDIKIEKKEAERLNKIRTHQLSDHAESRPPIIAIMGHVDHGKTTLLDSILDMKVVEGESGGITQHISAYQTVYKDRLMTLLDTPGHEAFAALRQHSAQLTDVVVIVVAADDGIKPQTIEAIKFARSANAKIIVAINKMDKPSADPNKVKSQFATDHDLNPEEWGGDTIFVEISAKTGDNIDKLLDTIFLVSDMEDLKADIDTPAEGLVIEARTEIGRGSVVGLLIEHGILKPGNFMVAGTSYGKVRTMQDHHGITLKDARPATPVVVTGFKQLPNFGDVFQVVKSEKEAKAIALAERIDQERNLASSNVTSHDILNLMNKEHDVSKFNIIIKADYQGSLTSVSESLNLIDTKGEVILDVVGSGVGNISENDINLAAGSGAVIYGFNVTLPANVKRLAMRENVEIKIFKVIYELIDDVKSSMSALLAPEIKETITGALKVKGVFKIAKTDAIIGGEVTKGKLVPGVEARVLRNKEELGVVNVVAVQRNKQEAKEVFEGELCGLNLKTAKRINFEEGDRLEFFTREIIERSL